MERNPRSMYRVAADVVNTATLYQVIEYAKLPNPITHLPPRRFDLLPVWLQDAIRMMDAAGDGHEVAGVGIRLSKHLYWVTTLDSRDGDT